MEHQIFPKCVCVYKRKGPRARHLKDHSHQSRGNHSITLISYKTAQDASLTLSRPSLGLTLLLPVATPVVTEAMICQSWFISSSGYMFFALKVPYKVN